MEGKPLDSSVKADAGAEASASGPGARNKVAKSNDDELSRRGAEKGSALSEEELDRLRSDIIAALKKIYDPEIPADIYELGLIYKIEVNDDREVAVEMTLTAPGCPVAGDMPRWVEDAVNTVPGIMGTKVSLTFDPPWDPSRMSEEARLALNMF